VNFQVADKNEIDYHFLTN